MARRRPRRPGGATADAGFVTAETAVVLPVLLTVLAAVLMLAHGAALQMAAQDAAALGARAAARGEADEVVRRLAVQVAPPGASVVVGRTAGLVRVRVSVAVLPRGSGPGLLGGFEVTSEAVAADESAAGAVG